MAEPKRYIIQFPDEDSYYAAMAIEAEGTEERPLEVEQRNLFVVSIDTTDVQFSVLDTDSELEGDTVVDESITQRADGSFVDPLELFRKNYGAKVYEDFQYEIDDDDIFEESNFGPEDDQDPSLDDVIDLIQARDVWADGYRGQRVAIAIVDTGIAGVRPEFPMSKRVGQWAPPQDDAWVDTRGHGSMCAAIAAGTTADGGLFDGVAPDAGLIACKTDFYTSELLAIYQYLIDLSNDEGLKIVASNSYGLKTGNPPQRPPNRELMRILDDAVQAGIVLSFSAGNNHQRAGGDPNDCHPTSIWMHKNREDLMAVATCDLGGAMWNYSSRGPGQHYGAPKTNEKPDVTGATPKNGRVVYGDNIRSLPNGWGTSGACPQVSGLAALVLSKDPSLSYDEVFDYIRNNTQDLGHPYHCQGTGRIDALSTVRAV